ncbi:hypothetical protein PIB30_039892 [Stylosanthes scabra]|uniref:Uncharacterized protein n=1 Tax=Stylosanthes scabra TaxID=79078 RepID=A0ABU6YGX4_9FABA|nr:hypothetical protein [Stylosanthes scabra]
MDAASHWYVRIGALGAYAQAPFLILGVSPKSSRCVRTSPWMRTHRLQNWPPSFSSRFPRSFRPFQPLLFRSLAIQT